MEPPKVTKKKKEQKDKLATIETKKKGYVKVFNKKGIPTKLKQN